MVAPDNPLALGQNPLRGSRTGNGELPGISIPEIPGGIPGNHSRMMMVARTNELESRDSRVLLSGARAVVLMVPEGADNVEAVPWSTGTIL